MKYTNFSASLRMTITTHVERLPDGRLKVCCYKNGESFCKYFFPRYFAARDKKRGGGSRNDKLDEKVVYRAIIVNMRPSDIKVKFGIDASVTHRIEAKGKKLGW